MSKAEQVPVTVHILDKEYKIACPPDERDALIKASHYLSDKMEEIRDAGRLVGSERVAVMAALHITHELLQSKGNRSTDISHLTPKLRQLQDKVEAALNMGRQLEF